MDGAIALRRESLASLGNPTSAHRALRNLGVHGPPPPPAAGGGLGGVAEPDGTSLETFTVWIGDAKFNVPRSFYMRGEYWDVLTTEDDALAWMWPLQMAKVATSGLTDDQLHHMWACIDLKNDQGWFFRRIDARGLGGYAGRTWYWITQYLAMYWEYTRDGEKMGYEDTLCAGLADARDSMFTREYKGPRWRVMGDTTALEHDQVTIWYEGHLGCDPLAKVGPASEKKCLSFATVWHENDGTPPPSDSGYLVYDLQRPTGGVPLGESRVHTRLASGGQGDRVLYFDTDTDSAFTSDYHAYASSLPDQHCLITARADHIGSTGRVVDAYLHWAHVAAALAVRGGTTDAIAYLYCAALLGKYAARAIVDEAEFYAHEVAHLFTGGAMHVEERSCSCSTAKAWATGVAAELGLPTGTGVYGLSDYPDIVWVFNQRCSLEADGVNHARYNYVYTVAEPGATGSARTFISYGDYSV